VAPQNLQEEPSSSASLVVKAKPAVVVELLSVNRGSFHWYTPSLSLLGAKLP
jgi:hypothetical protein